MARKVIGFWPASRPVCVQVAPPSVLLKTRCEAAHEWSAPAYSVRGLVGSTTSEEMQESVSPCEEALQVPPPSVLLKTPPPRVAARSVGGLPGLEASAETGATGSPLLAACQVPPPSGLL